MRLFGVNHLVLLVLAVVGIASRSDANIITVPPGLSPGETYRLVFVTADTTTATSTNIADYNDFVTSEANDVAALAALRATWMVIGSTESVSAVTNIGPSSAGIYTLDGAEVATSTAALFSTITTPLLSPIDITQYGSPIMYEVFAWTGAKYDGTHFTDLALGDPTAEIGCIQDTSIGYLDCFPNNPQNWQFPQYAISSELTVGGATPEPGTIALTALGGAMLFLARRRKQQYHMATRTDRAPPAHR
ncbi:MAG: PEP-CTERM sorting domain-containing protein [Bryobacteraceae bacterium]